MAGSLATVIRSYKAAVTRWARQHGHDAFRWQGRFYEHVIRNDAAHQRIQRYILENPLRWQIRAGAPNPPSPSAPVPLERLTPPARP